MNNQHLILFKRSEKNPILTAADWHYQANSVINTGETLLNHLLSRVEERNGQSYLYAARSS